MAAVVAIQTLLKFLDKSQGRDKLSKLLQYLAKLFSWITKENPDLAKRLATFASVTGDARRLSRFCNELSFIPNLKDAISNPTKFADPVEIVSFVSAFGMANYLFWDHLRWLGSTKVLDGDVATWKQRSVTTWFWGILLGILATTIKLYRNSARTQKIKEGTIKAASAEELTTLEKQRKTMLISYCKTIPDLICSATFANYTDRFNHDGFIGLMGCISALQGFYELWPQ